MIVIYLLRIIELSKLLVKGIEISLSLSLSLYNLIDDAKTGRYTVIIERVETIL